MADRASIAIRQEQALTRLRVAAERLAVGIGVELAPIPTRANNPEMLRALQFEVFADWIEQIADISEQDGDTQPMHTGYSPMTKAELIFELRKRGIEIDSIQGTGANGNVLVSDLIGALEANDNAHG